jgi:predicted GH43/DUF377 family glycosyl hydrolase
MIPTPKALLLVVMLIIGSTPSSAATLWEQHPSSFPPPQWKVVKGGSALWEMNPRDLTGHLTQNAPAWVLSGVDISGDWILEATFVPPFVHRDEGLLINMSPDLSRGYLVSIGPLGKLTLLRIKNGEIDSVAIQFPIFPALGPRTLRVTRVGANYDFWLDGIFVGDIANPLQERVDPPRWTDAVEPDSGQYGVAFQSAGTRVVRNISLTPLHLAEKYLGNPVLRPLGKGSWEENGIFTGGILREQDTYYLYYSGTYPAPPAKDQPPEGITRAGVALSKDLVTWTRGLHNPILEEGPVGSWDRALQVGCVVPAPTQGYALFYDGYDGKRWGGVGVAFSDSPLGPFKKYEGNPVLRNGGPSEFDHHHIHLHTCLRLDDGRYALLYTGFRASDDPQKERSGDQGGLALSRDLLNWKKYEKNPVLTFAPLGTFYDAHLRPKGIIKLDEWYYLFFEGAHFDKLWFDQASLARSKDLINWEKFPYPLPSLGTGDSYDSIVTEWPVPTIGPGGDVIVFYMCLPLGGYSQGANNPNKLSICMAKLPASVLENWDEFMMPLTRPGVSSAR